MPYIIKININNTIETINININNSNINKNLLKISTDKGQDNIIELYTWNNKKIKAYGWISGINNENKHKLPPQGKSKINKIQSEKIKLYGNIFIMAFNKNKIIDYNISEYGELYYILTSHDSDLDNSNENSNLYKKSKKGNINNLLDTDLLDEDLTEYK